MKATYITLFLCITAYAYNRKSVSFAMPQIIEEGLDESHAGLVITLQNAAFAASKFSVGVLSDRYSPTLLFLSGLLVSGLVTALFSWTSLLPLLCLLWAFNGFAQGANWPPVVKIVQQKSSPSQFGTLCSLLLSANNLACCASPVLSAYIVASYSWRTSVYVAGLTSMILCLFAVFVLQRSSTKSDLSSDEKTVTETNSPVNSSSDILDSPKDDKNMTPNKRPDDSKSADPNSLIEYETMTPSNSSDDPASNSADAPSTFTDLLKDPFLWLVSTGYLVISCYHTTLLDWGQLFLIAERGRTKKEASFFISSMEIGGFFGGIMAGYLTDLFIRYRKKVSDPNVQVTAANSRLFVLGIFMLLVVAFLNLLHSAVKESSSFVWIVCVGCLLGIFVYGSDAIIGVVSSECAPAHLSGSALALSSLAGNVGAMVTGYPFCTTAKYFSWAVVFVILEVMTLLMLCAIVFCRNLQPKHLRGVRTEKYPNKP